MGRAAGSTWSSSAVGSSIWHVALMAPGPERRSRARGRRMPRSSASTQPPVGWWLRCCTRTIGSTSPPEASLGPSVAVYRLRLSDGYPALPSAATGCGAIWQRACFGSTRLWVQIPPPRPRSPCPMKTAPSAAPTAEGLSTTLRELPAIDPDLARLVGHQGPRPASRRSRSSSSSSRFHLPQRGSLVVRGPGRQTSPATTLCLRRHRALLG